MMNNTYSLIISQSERAWSYQWARTLLALERRLNDEQRQAHLRKYAINVAAVTSRASDEEADGGDNDGDGDQPDVIERSAVPVESGAGAVSEAISARPGRDAAKAAKPTNSGGAGNKKSDEFVPALMIIKQMPFTRAEQRRRLVNYWQVSARPRRTRNRLLRQPTDWLFVFT